MPPEGVAILTAITLVGAFVCMFPVCRALAERIRARADGGVRDELVGMREDLVQEIQQVRHEIAELSERVDFTERLLAKKSHV